MLLKMTVAIYPVPGSDDPEQQQREQFHRGRALGKLSSLPARTHCSLHRHEHLSFVRLGPSTAPEKLTAPVSELGDPPPQTQQQQAPGELQ